MTKKSNLISRIILVDDDEDDRDLFAEAFQSLNLKSDFVQFKNGQELLDYIKEIDHSIATLVFLDLNMPIISGMEVLKQLRKTLNINDVFITIYSTSSSQKDVENAYNFGANGYLRKPSNFQHLCKLIYKAIDTVTTNRGNEMAKEEFVLK